MEPISFRCPACDHMLKVPAERAGRGGRCPKCKKEFTIPSVQDKAPSARAAAGGGKKPPPPIPGRDAPGTEAGAAAPTAPAPPSPAAGGDEDGPTDGKGYGLLIDPREEAERKRKQEEEERKARERKAAEPKHKIQRRKRTLKDPEMWVPVRAGLTLVFIGACLFGAAFVLRGLVIVLGIFDGPAYATLAERVLHIPIEEEPAPGTHPPRDVVGFMIGLISGYTFLGLGEAIFILNQVLYLVMTGLWMTAMFKFQAAPDRFGMRLMPRMLVWVLGINIVVILFLQLLPLCRAYRYVNVPLVAPEIALGEGNIERIFPLHIYWTGAPFWEMFLTFFLQFLFYLPAGLIAVWMWSAAKHLKDDIQEEKSSALSQGAFGTYFILFTYMCLTVVGTSEVMVLILRIVYLLWSGFFLGYAIWFILRVKDFQQNLDKLLEDNPVQEKDEEEDEDDEDDRPRRRRYDDDDDDEDEDDEYDDDEDEEDEPPRRRGRGRPRDEDDDD